MIQKKIVTSGTLLSVRRREVICGRDVALVLVMAGDGDEGPLNIA